jgi:hypothetical protein
MAAFNKFNVFVLDVCNAIHDLKTGTTDVYKVLLTNTLPVAGDTVVDTTTTPCTVKATSNAVEVAATADYTKGGATIGVITGSQSSGTFKFIGGTDPAWTATVALGPFQYAVLYNSSKGAAATRPVIGWWTYTASTTLGVGESFTVDLDQTGGVFTLA